MKTLRLALCLLFTVAALMGAVQAGPYSVRRVETNRSAIGQTACKAGYQIRACIAPQQAKASRNGARFTIRIGVPENSKAQTNAARLWALYE